MTATRLAIKPVPKVWGRRSLPAEFCDVPTYGQPIGEVCYSDQRSDDAELVVKYLFTSQKLSIQVHPGQETAQAAGYARGKDESWFVTSANPGATIGIGLRESVGRAELKAAAQDGRIEGLIAWHPVKEGDFFYSPAGTIHVIGADVSVVEIQQNLDLTYRLYDYGRPRELHLDQAAAVADTRPYTPAPSPISLEPGRMLLADGPAFVVERWSGTFAGGIEAPFDRPVWLVPLKGFAHLDEEKVRPGEVSIVHGPSELVLASDADLLLAYPGGGVMNDLRSRSR